MYELFSRLDFICHNHTTRNAHCMAAAVSLAGLGRTVMQGTHQLRSRVDLSLHLLLAAYLSRRHARACCVAMQLRFARFCCFVDDCARNLPGKLAGAHAIARGVPDQHLSVLFHMMRSLGCDN